VWVGHSVDAYAKKKRELQACSILRAPVATQSFRVCYCSFGKTKGENVYYYSNNFDYDVTFVDFFYKKTISLPLAAFFGGNNRGRFRLPCSFCQATSPSALHSFADSAAGLVRMHPARELAPSLMR
jgi:hypothetical protein